MTVLSVDWDGLAKSGLQDRLAGQWREFARGSMEQWRKDPLLLEFVQRSAADPDRRVRTVRDVLGEQLGVAFSLTVQALEDDDPYLAQTGAGVSLGVPYLWLDRVWQLAQETPVPSHVVSRTVLPFPICWFTLEGAISNVEGFGEKVDAVLVHDQPEALAVTIVGSDGGKPKTHSWGVPYGKRYPDDFDAEDGAAIGAVLSLLAFINSPYIPKVARRLDRGGRRKRLAAGMDPAGNDEVRFVDLRMPETLTFDSEADGADRNYRHRWIVRGHNRAQWYPSEGAHHLIYVAPYVKGPEDAPLLERQYRVVR